MKPADGNGAGWSLRWRVLAAGAAVVVAFLLLAGVAVDRAFRDSLEASSRERLLARIYMLMGAAEVAADGELRMPAELPEPRLAIPGSGSYAAISDAGGSLLWRSDSAIGLQLDYPLAREPGDSQLDQAAAGDAGPLLMLAYPVFWELEGSADRILVFQAAESRAALDAELAAFRNTLQLWLGGGAIVLLLMQAAALVWSLAPIERVAEDLRDIESGVRDSLGTGYPRELRRLTDRLNALLHSRDARLRRYRNSLADLAHSLKTPLAVLRTRQNDDEDETDNETRQQLDQMQATIDYYLQRASVTGRSPLAAPVAVRPAAMRVIDSLRKIYHDKRLQFECDISERASFAGDPGDLAELLGNLGDNACKWARSRVRIAADNAAGSAPGERLVLLVDDDGPGIPPELQQAVLQRGVRADTRQPGQGIGLSVVRETVEEVYGGRVSIEASELGGACLRLELP